VQVIRVRRGEIARSLTLPGNVRAYQEATLYAKVAGYLERIHVDRGDTVERGQVLAEIEVPELVVERARYHAELDIATVELERLEAAQQDAPDLVMPQSVDAARAKRDVARANLQRAETLLGYCRITAPFAGVITKRWLDPGALVPAATSSTQPQSAALVSLSDFGRVRIDVAIPEPDVPGIDRGLPVEVTCQALPGRRFSGGITRLAYALDGATKTMAAEIEIPNPDQALRPGMFVSVKIELQRQANALLVPAEAVLSEKGNLYVFTVADSVAKKLPIRAGFDDGISVAVLEGLVPDQPVIVAGKQAIRDGQRVRAVEMP
jgi:membrane fusion protein (multidrug efflux system)